MKIQFLVNWDHLEETDLALENTNSGQFTLGTYNLEVTSGSYISWSSYSENEMQSTAKISEG